MYIIFFLVALRAYYHVYSFRKSVMLIDKSTNDPQRREEPNTKYPIKGFTKVTFEA